MMTGLLIVGRPSRCRGKPLGLKPRYAPDTPPHLNGCHTCELEVSPETGSVASIDYAIVETLKKFDDHHFELPAPSEKT
jgi:hypothetical protein